MKTEFRNKVLKLALPIAAQQFMLALVSACDAFMLGGLNQNSLSAVSGFFFIATLFVPETLMRLFTNDI